MDKKMLLEDGLLEQYVLGELNVEQCKQVEQLIVSDTEIKTALKNIEASFEQIGKDNAIAPPMHVKEKLLAEISSYSDKKAIPIASKTNTRLYLGIAASFAAFLLLGSVWLYSELNAVKDELKIVKQLNDILKEDLSDVKGNYEETNKWYAALSNPNTIQYILEGNDLAPKAKIISYVNHSNKSVVINTQKLPKIDTEHDYQMWADVDGEMIDMGVIPKDKALIAMTYIDDAESLNITIEPAGGNDHPTVERLISNVYLD